MYLFFSYLPSFGLCFMLSFSNLSWHTQTLLCPLTVHFSKLQVCALVWFFPPVDECKLGTANCPANDSCVNTHGSFQCCSSMYDRQNIYRNKIIIGILIGSFSSQKSQCLLVCGWACLCICKSVVCVCVCTVHFCV